MKKVQLKDLKLKSLFRLVNDENARYWVKYSYDRTEKRYCCYLYDDVNKFRMFKGNKLVFVEDYE